ncbi:MAG TPA: ATP-binding protein [Kofleriaceae bacterium]|nr:ATP-binding protein [Kofleriaceae bacterium]
MPRRLKLRHRIAVLVSLAAIALVVVTAVTLVLGRRSEAEINGIETRYLPLIELGHDLKITFAQIPHALEDAANAADETKLAEADALEAELAARIVAGGPVIRENGGDPGALRAELTAYFLPAREVSAAIVAGRPADQLAAQIGAMRRAQQAFTAKLEAATSPDRKQLAAAFATARASQTTTLWTEIAVACVVLAVMSVVSWQLIRRTVSSLAAVSAGVERLARGEFGREIDVPFGDEIGDLAREANRTAERLRDYREHREREDWIKTGIGELGDRIAGELDPEPLVRAAMAYLADRVGAVRADRRVGDQAARAQPTLAVVDRVVTVPFCHAGRVLATLELELAVPPSERVLDFLGRIRGVAGIAVQVAESRVRARALLVETQRQAIAAETANKELEAFSYSVSHDLRAPLRGIDGFSQALIEDHAEHLPAKAQDYLRRIRAAAQRMAELIDDLLRLSRVSRGDFKRERVDLSAIAASILADLQRGEPARAVDTIVQPEIVAHADPRLLKITLENLLGNAWKFSAKTERARIEFGAADERGERVYFVRDNGAGFDMSYVDRLFVAFQRLHSAKEFAGTGIGLATVQRVVLRHGGRIWAESELGQGTTFRFTLPEGATSP